MFGEVMVRFLRKPIAVFGAVIMIVVVALCLLAPVIAPYDIDAQDITRKFTEPSQEFICGTDNLGRDIFSRLLYGHSGHFLSSAHRLVGNADNACYLVSCFIKSLQRHNGKIGRAHKKYLHF